MNFKKLTHKRRAVSPILAAVLLIGLAITAGAILFVVVIPLITAPGGSVVFDESTTTLSATSLHLVLKNEGSVDATITNVTVDGVTPATFSSFTVTKGQGAIKDYTVSLTAGTYTVTVSFTAGETSNSISITLTVT
ncbi:MAG: archaellin/type IV pilin N-terminal domain-containing protein [Candidatus Hodarchaeota archaeon]